MIRCEIKKISKRLDLNTIAEIVNMIEYEIIGLGL